MHNHPKKSLGQNFLIDPNIARKIVEIPAFGPYDTVLEIGAGRGALTERIAGKVRELVALELDRRLCEDLAERLRGIPGVSILNRDILKFDLQAFFRRTQNVKVIGNIPYCITTPIIEHLFVHRRVIEAAWLTVQKEFARRMTAAPGSKEYGSLSIFTRYYSETRILFAIKNTCFYPAPKVDSCFVHMRMRRELPLCEEEEKLFFGVVRKAFGQRRKTLRNSLLGVFPREKLETFFRRYSIDPRTRPEDLAVADLIHLIKI